MSLLQLVGLVSSFVCIHPWIAVSYFHDDNQQYRIQFLCFPLRQYAILVYKWKRVCACLLCCVLIQFCINTIICCHSSKQPLPRTPCIHHPSLPSGIHTPQRHFGVNSCNAETVITLDDTWYQPIPAAEELGFLWLWVAISNGIILSHQLHRMVRCASHQKKPNRNG
jgi:hypothetical protein